MGRHATHGVHTQVIGRMIIFLRLLLGHLVGDFALQTGKVARGKLGGWRGLLIHAGLVTFSMLCFGAGAFAGWLPCILALGVAHLLIDSVRTFLVRGLPPQRGLLYLAADQTAHILTLLATTVWGAQVPWHDLWRPPQFALNVSEGQLLGLSCLILLVWVEPVVEMEILRAMTVGIPAVRPTIHPVDRILGALERLLLLNLLLIGFVGLAPLVLVPRLVIYRTLGNLRQEPLFSLALIRASTSALFVVAMTFCLYLL